MIEHDRTGQAIPQARGLGDLIAAHVDLDVPAAVVDPLGERLDHVDRRRGGARIELAEADAANAAAREGVELGIGDGGMDDRDAARVAELRDGVERHAIVGAVGRGRHDHRALRADALLQEPILGHAGIGLHPRVRPRRRKALGVVDVHVAVAGAGRRGELRSPAAGRVRHRLRAVRLRGGCAHRLVLRRRPIIGFWPQSALARLLPQ